MRSWRGRIAVLVEYLTFCSCIVLGLVFVLSAFLKIANLRIFRETVSRFQLLPSNLIAPVAFALPFFELLIGSCFVWATIYGVGSVMWAFYSATAMLVIFTIAVAVNLIRGRRNIPCGCFGAAGHGGLSWLLVGRNCLLSATALIGLFSNGQPLSAVFRLDAALLVLSAVLAWRLLFYVLYLHDFK